MVCVGVAALAIDGAEDAAWVEGFHEGAGAVVDRLAGDGGVVGVHDAVDEAEEHPLGDQFGVTQDDAGEECTIGGGGVLCFWIVAGEGVIGQRPEAFEVVFGEEVLEGTHP